MIDKTHVRRIGRTYICRFTADEMRALYESILAGKDQRRKRALLITRGRFSLIWEGKVLADAQRDSQ